MDGSRAAPRRLDRGGAVSIAVIMTIGLLAVIAVRGLGHFWPADLIQANYNVPGQANHIVIGEVVQKEEVPRERLKSAGLPVPDAGPEFMTRELIKVGNRDLNGNDFTWIVGEWLKDQATPKSLMTIERRERATSTARWSTSSRMARSSPKAKPHGPSCKPVSSV